MKGSEPNASDFSDDSVAGPHEETVEHLSADDRSTPAFPTEVPGFQLVREISRGGQGVVYEARQLSTGKRVAVKVIKDGPFATPREKARFEREVQILVALEHPNIVTVLDRGTTTNGFYYLVMPFVAGRRLDHYLADKRDRDGEVHDPSNLLKLFMKICDAVNAAHLRGVVHRDLKPGNILVADDAEPRILDFGVARAGFGLSGEVDAADAEAAGPQPVTITGQFIGSLPWASPEQAEGIASRIDTRSDVYSLGVVLYQMLTGQFPYVVAGTMRDVLNNILTAEPTPPSVVVANRQTQAFEHGRRPRRQLRPAVNEAIEAIVLKSLSKRRQDRYQTAGEFGRDIANYLSGKPTAAHTTHPRRRSLGFLPAGKRPLLIGAAASAVLIGSWLAYHHFNPGPPDPSPAPAPAASGWQRGDRVLASSTPGGYWFPGTVRQVDANGKFLIGRDDGTQESVDGARLLPEDIRVGDAIEGNRKSTGQFFAGAVVSRDGDRVGIRYEDGSTDAMTLGNVRVVRPRGAAPPAPPTIASNIPTTGPSMSTVPPAVDQHMKQMLDLASPEKMMELFPKFNSESFGFPSTRPAP
jgi:serine/threonine protein kinase